MNRRDFLTKALISGAFLSSGKAMAWEYGKKGGGTEQKMLSGSQNNIRKIDSYCHYSPTRLLKFLDESGGGLHHANKELFLNIPTLINVDERLKLMDRYGIEMHILVPLPQLEFARKAYGDPELSGQAASICNNELAKIVARYPERFAAVALLPTFDPEVMIAEFDRAIKDLGLVGGVVFIGPTIKAVDHQDYESLYQRAAEMDVPIWFHPTRPITYPDHLGEKFSKYGIWQGLGWVMDSSTAMVRLVFSGIFERYSNIKFVIHHHGALIPLFAKRLESNWEFFERRGGVDFDTSITKPYIDHFKNFYCDTVTMGFEPLLLQIAYNFFGPDHLLFGTDAPMGDPEIGRKHIPQTMKCVEALPISEADRKKIFSGNALRILKRA